MEVIITAATVASMFFNMANAPEQSGFAYNAQMNGNKVETVRVLKSTDEGLFNKLQYAYDYDSEDRLVKKTVKRWNSVANTWENAYELKYTYAPDGYILVRRDWNKKTQKFDDAKQMMNYKMIQNNVMAVNTYELNKNNDYVMVNNVLVMNHFIVRHLFCFVKLLCLLIPIAPYKCISICHIGIVELVSVLPSVSYRVPSLDSLLR